MTLFEKLEAVWPGWLCLSVTVDADLRTMPPGERILVSMQVTLAEKHNISEDQCRALFHEVHVGKPVLITCPITGEPTAFVVNGVRSECGGDDDRVTSVLSLIGAGS